MDSLRNKVAIVTGSSAGIGEGTAVLFAKLGCHLTLTGRDDVRLKAVVQRCVEAGCPADKITTVLGDVRDDAVQQQVLDKTLAAFGRVDILVNNAGVGGRGEMLATGTTEAEYDRMMDTNAKSVFFLSKLIAPELIKTKGNIVNVGSLFGVNPFPPLSAYSMSKAALEMYNKCLALELAEKGVRVNIVNPGVIVSIISRRGPTGHTDQEFAQYLEDSKKVHPLGFVGQPEDVANTIAFLASDMARFITGTSIFVDGGRHCLNQ